MHSVLAAPGVAMDGTVHAPHLGHRAPTPHASTAAPGACLTAGRDVRGCGAPCRTHVPLLYVLLLQLIYTGQPRCSVLTRHSTSPRAADVPGWLAEWLHGA